jgi:hypothetical protein
MDQIRFTPNIVRTGDYILEDPRNIESRVLFVDKTNGKFTKSMDWDKDKTCQMQQYDGVWYPVNSKCTGGGDPFRMSKTEGNKMSNGGGAVFLDRDYILDPPNKDPKDWTSYRFIETYNCRPATTDEYAMDMLMMCRYNNAPLCAETNVALLIEKFTEWGFLGFLLYLYNTDGTLRNTPGVHAGEDSKQQMMLRMRNYISGHIHKEKHFDLLDQCMKIPNINKLTDYDLLTACGWALYGSEKGYKDYMGEKPKQKFDQYNLLNYLPVKKIA